MRNALRGGLIACTLGLGISALVAPLGGQAQTPAYRAPRAAELDRIYRAYPHLNDDDFVATHREEWLEG